MCVCGGGAGGWFILSDVCAARCPLQSVDEKCNSSNQLGFVFGRHRVNDDQADPLASTSVADESLL